MCIAILNQKQTTLKKEILRNCWENNGDGAGILYTNNNKQLETFKEMKSFDTFYNKYLEVRRLYGKRNMVLHFRISTHGRVNETNCHPFLVDDTVGFVHNGMIYDVPNSPDYSDTYMFNEKVLKEFKQGFHRNNLLLDIISDFIGNGSKLVFLDVEDNWTIVNEDAGHWNLGCWFSNSSYKQVNNWVDYGGTKKYKTYETFTGKPFNTLPTTTNKEFSWASDEREMHFCECCDMYLHGVDEINNGLCCWCKDEQMLLDEYNNECELCEKEVGTYNDSFNATVCTTCKESLGA
jgi:predicted glutamine amidotransferase